MIVLAAVVVDVLVVCCAWRFIANYRRSRARASMALVATSAVARSAERGEAPLAARTTVAEATLFDVESVEPMPAPAVEPATRTFEAADVVGASWPEPVAEAALEPDARAEVDPWTDSEPVPDPTPRAPEPLPQPEPGPPTPEPLPQPEPGPPTPEPFPEPEPLPQPEPLPPPEPLPEPEPLPPPEPLPAAVPPPPAGAEPVSAGAAPAVPQTVPPPPVSEALLARLALIRDSPGSWVARQLLPDESPPEPADDDSRREDRGDP